MPVRPNVSVAQRSVSRASFPFRQGAILSSDLVVVFSGTALVVGQTVR
jgi:hypothetical protein